MTNDPEQPSDVLWRGIASGAKLALAHIVAAARKPLLDELEELNRENARLMSALELSETTREQLHRELQDGVLDPPEGDPP